MKKLFIQFYLLLFVCFLVMSLLVGLVYKFTAERAGKQSLDDLMNSSLYLMRSELREIPPHDWGKTLKEMDLNLSFDLRVEPLSKYHLDDISMHRLRGGEIVALDDQYTFLQRIPRSHYVLAVGPVPYLYYLHQMRLLDIALIAFIAISLAFPVFIWMRPHWHWKQRRNDLAMGISMNVSTLMRVRALNDLVSHLTRWRTISTP